MESLTGTSGSVFLIVTVIIMGFTAYMTGQALANTWKPWWHTIVYCVFLGLADRFLTFALFEGELLSLPGLVIDTAVIAAIGLVSYRMNQAGKMVSQYPWLYERTGLFGWRKRTSR